MLHYFTPSYHTPPPSPISLHQISRRNTLTYSVSVAQWSEHSSFTSERDSDPVFHSCEELVNTLPKVMGFLRALRFPPTRNVYIIVCMYPRSIIIVVKIEHFMLSVIKKCNHSCKAHLITSTCKIFAIEIIYDLNLGQEKGNEEQLQDEKGSKYFVSRRQSVPVPYQQQNVVGYVPVYYTPQYYNTYQPVYTSYYQPYMLGSTVAQQYLSGGQSFGYSDYPLLQTPFMFSKR